MLKITHISQNITLFTGTSSVNSVLIEYEEFVIVIDTMLLPKDSKELAFIIKNKNKPVKYILNTHWHSDHCYGNRFVKDDNTVIIAHENFLETITSEKNVLYPGRKNVIENSKLVFPDITFSDKIILKEKPELHFLHLPGHSPDSSIIWIPTEKIIIAGDNILNSNNGKIAIPYFFWGNPNELLNSLKKIIKLKPEKILPGHGNIADLNKVEKDILYLENITEEYKKSASTRQSKKNLNLSECDLIPNTKPEDFWVHKMHTMNIEKMNKIYNIKFSEE